MTEKKNVIAAVLQILGVFITVAYGFRAIILYGQYGGGIAFEIFLQGVIFGALFVGISEVIKLMQGLFNQREPERPVVDVEKSGRAALQKANESTVSLETRNRIMDFYTKNNVVVDDIEATPYEGYAIVDHGGQRDVVDLNNWELEVLTEGQLRNNSELRGLLE